MKTKSTIGLALLAVAAGALASCGPSNPAGSVQFWSSFGATYRNVLDPICGQIGKDLGFDVIHESQGSYPDIKKNMMSAIAVGDYPNIAMGYPDHFAEYLGADILKPLDNYLTSDLLEDYYEDYMTENYFYDSSAEKHAFAVPFNKSTELLGYNGTFVEWCKTKDPSLGTLPVSWQEWAEKGPAYLAVYDELLDNHYCVYGRQAIDGSVSDLVAKRREGQKDAAGDYHDADGRVALLDFTDVQKKQTRLMSWDATDNAFITLIKQWGAEYTELPEEQKTTHPFYRIGDLKFASKANKPKVIECLRFFKKLNKQRIFGIPSELNSSFSSEAFATGNVMFMVCSSGGLSYNTKTWHSRFRVAPIPYYDDGVTTRKLVISQGANICMTDKGDFDNSFNVIKNLTTGAYQTEWCLQTGYYPCSKSAAESDEYKAFLTEAEPANIQAVADATGLTYDEVAASVYSSPARVAYREGSALNTNEYMTKVKGWTKFVDAAFIGSSSIRDVVANALKLTINAEGDVDADDIYNSVINKLIKDESIADNTNINIVTD